MAATPMPRIVASTPLRMMSSTFSTPAVPLAASPQRYARPISTASAPRAMAFTGLTAVAFITRKDLSFLRPIVMYGFVAALVLIVAAALFGLSLGVWFVLGMIVLSGVAILYQTQTIIREFPVAAHVGAALALFSSVMTLFWYILQLVGIMRD